MAHFHRDRDHTDPFPLRRVVRSRPLTQDEVEAIYGQAYGLEDRKPYKLDKLDAGDVSHPRWERAAFPVVASRAAPEAVYPTNYADEYVESREYPDDVIELPVRRARWWPLVVLVLIGAIAFLVYALGRSGIESLAFAELDQVDLAPLPVDRPALTLAGDSWVAFSAAQAVASEATSADEAADAESEAAATAPAPRPRAQPAQPAQPAPRRFLPAPPPAKKPAAPPAADPYPDLSEDDTMDQLRGLEGEAVPTEPTKPAAAAPAEKPAEPEENWDALPEQKEPPPDSIVRDPGF